MACSQRGGTKATAVASESTRRRNLIYLALLSSSVFWAIQFPYTPLSACQSLSAGTQQDKNGALNSQISGNNETEELKSTVLMMQYIGERNNSSYASLLDLTGPVNKAYAEQWGYDYMLVTGYLIQAELADTSITVPESRATYNKVMILEQVLTDARYQQYTALLLLDSDALMYDFSRNIVSTLLPRDKILVAHQVESPDPVHRNTAPTFNINIGVTLWNLRHPSTLSLVQVWKSECLYRIQKQPHLRDSDQTPLQNILRQMTPAQQSRLILALSDNELGYSHGRYIRHFIRPNAKNWTATNGTIQSRRAQIEASIDTICGQSFTAQHHPPAACGYYFHSQ
jgi:hypothetical protein